MKKLTQERLQQMHPSEQMEAYFAGNMKQTEYNGRRTEGPSLGAQTRWFNDWRSALSGFASTLPAR